MSKILKISIFSLICVIFIGTLFVNLNNDVESYENEKSQKQQEIYTIKEYDGKIAVYKNDENKPMEVYESYVSLLPEADRQKLQNGITVDNTTELQKIIEDYTSQKTLISAVLTSPEIVISTIPLSRINTSASSPFTVTL